MCPFPQVRTAAPSAQLSASLRFRLEKCDFPKRQEVCAMSKDGCSPLFIACKRGNVEVSELTKSSSLDRPIYME